MLGAPMPSGDDDERRELLKGRYAIVGRLGAGAQGETLEAEDRETGRRVAVKRFFVRGATSWKDVELAEREALVQQALDHPNLPKYVDHFEVGGALCLVMERIEGETLAALGERGTVFGVQDILRFLDDASSALDYLHQLAPPIIHRDIKPANVIRRPDGSFALVDFGSVRHRLRSKEGSTVAGTFGYMAPEQLQGRAGPESDVYAVAATALAAVTGMQPEELPHRGLAVDVAKAMPARSDRRLRLALAAMLEPNPERRPNSVAEVLGRFGLARGGATGGVLVRTARWLDYHRRLALGGAVVCAALGVVAMRRHPPSTSTAASARGEPAWSSAERAWQLGDLPAAGRAFAAARRLDRTRDVSLREVEAVSVFDPRGAVGLVQSLKSAWYKGPTDPALALLDCIAAALHDDVPVRDNRPPLCLRPPLDRRDWDSWQGTESSHGMPGNALRDPANYVRFWPIYAGSELRSGCGAANELLQGIANLNCAADRGARRALFAAMAGDGELLDQELALTDGLLEELKMLLSRPNNFIDPSGRASARAEGVNPLTFFQNERDRLRFDAERALAVAATAAWFGHDDTHVAAYLPYAEAHARAILEEHVALVSGAKRIPDAEHSPSDFSPIDMDFFRSIEAETPQRTLQKMRDLGYSEPARLAELFGGGRAPQTREALARWVREGFVAPAPQSGIFELFEATFRRREAARLVGDKKLEAELLEITRKLGKTLRDPRAFAPTASLESLLAR